MLLDPSHIAFLTEAGWHEADHVAMPGDASSKRFLRLRRGQDRALLMTTQNDPAISRRFGHVAQLLSDRGLRSPKIFARDMDRGYLLIEDFGDALFAREIAANAALERPLSDLAIDALIELGRYPAPDLPRYEAQTAVEQAEWSVTWYAGRGAADYADLSHALADALTAIDTPNPTLMLRDFHAENLVYLPKASGLAQAGIIDFQDAMIAHPAYDLASFLQDARRDLPPDTLTRQMRRFAEGSGMDEAALSGAFACYGAARSLRILGVFARLSLFAGKARYVDMIPRVWAHLEANLTHPALANVARHAEKTLPRPTTGLLHELREKCGTHQTA